jgi:Ca-activated chloride channel homolog
VSGLGDITFQSAGWLWLLALLPLAAAGYALAARRRRSARLAWADPEALDPEPPRAGRAARGIAFVLCCAAAALAVVALARPSTYGPEGDRRSVVVLTIDISASMNRTDLAPDRMTAAIDAGNRFLDGVPDDTLVGLVTFARGARVLVAPTADRAQVREQIGALRTERGGTALGEALITSLGALRAAGAIAGGLADPAASPGRILLLTDGVDTAPNAATPAQAAERAALDGVPVFSILLGEDPADEALGGATPAETLSAISTRTGGVLAQTATTPDLLRVLDDIGRVVTPVDRLRELSAWPAGAALILLLAAGAMLVVARAAPARGARHLRRSP